MGVWLTSEPPTVSDPTLFVLMVRDTSQPVVMQRANELSRLLVDGKRTDNDERCMLLAVREVGGTWALYLHGDPKLGVRITVPEAAAFGAELAGGSR
jgi:hypothetical protein